jgi:large subunit ribosomal protein L25
MEKALLLKAQIREKTGKHASATLRDEGKLPATIYGHKQEPVAVTLDFHDTIEGLHHGSRIADVEINGKKETVMFKDLQYDYLGKDIIHVDLMRVNVSETVKVVVPIVIKGIAEGTKQGGIVNEHTASLEVECKVTDIPESITVVIKDINVGDTIYAGDIKLPAGAKLVSDPKLLVLNCTLVAAAKTTEEIAAELPIQPEVIGEKKREEESEEK